MPGEAIGNNVASALLTDLYELTMAQGYLRAGQAEQQAAFHLYFRRHPFGGGYAVARGLADAVARLATLHFTSTELAYLQELRAEAGQPLFAADFLRYLADLRLRLDVDAVPEGTVVCQPRANACAIRLRSPSGGRRRRPVADGLPAGAIPCSYGAHTWYGTIQGVGAAPG